MLAGKQNGKTHWNIADCDGHHGRDHQPDADSSWNSGDRDGSIVALGYSKLTLRSGVWRMDRGG